MRVSSKTGIVLLILALIAGGIYWASRPDPVKVQLHQVKTGTVEETVANTRAGTVKACRRAKLSLSVGGQIGALNVSEGDRVDVGDILLELWNDDLKAQVRLAEQQLNASRARVEEACALAEAADRDASRLTRLYKQGAVSDEARDTAVSKARSQQAACAASRADLKVSQARLEANQAALDRTILRAPFSGIVAEINGELSEYVTPSPIGIATPPAVDLIDGCCIYVSAPIDEVDAPKVEAGQTVRISLDAYPDTTFPGRVRRVAPYIMEAESEARTVDIEVDFIVPGEATSLMPGYSADVEILLDAHEDVMRIPSESVLEDDKVYVYQPETHRLQLRSIHTGLRNWQWVEVTAGLELGDQVVTTVDREGVRDGAAAEPETTDAAP